MPRMPGRIVALVAAYALALQAIFALAAAASVAPSSHVAICAGEGQPSTPAHHKCEACLAGHCAGTAGNPARGAFAAPWPPRTQHATTAPPRRRPGAAARKIAAHAPRAPPRG